MHEGVTIYPLYVVGKSSVVSLTVATALSVASGTVAGDAAEAAAEEEEEEELPFILKVNIERVSGKFLDLSLFSFHKDIG